MNSVILTCSSNDGKREPQNVLIYDDSCWQSRSEPNSWICFNFTTKRIMLYGYLLRHYFYNGLFPRNWKIEGSQNEDNWELIDQRINDSSINQPFQEIIFQVESKTPFPLIKITQTGPNSRNDYYFQFSFIEFFGKVFENKI